MGEEAIYCAVGQFVLAFQAVESRLREIIWFCTDPRHTSETREPMAGESFSKTVARMRKEVTPFIQKWGGELSQELIATLRAATRRCQKLARRRNEIVHSGYIHHERGESTLAVTRAYLKRASGGRIVYEYESMTLETFSADMKEIGEVMQQLNAIHTQLIHRYRP